MVHDQVPDVKPETLNEKLLVPRCWVAAKLEVAPVGLVTFIDTDLIPLASEITALNEFVELVDVAPLTGDIPVITGPSVSANLTGAACGV